MAKVTLQQLQHTECTLKKSISDVLHMFNSSAAYVSLILVIN